jgi:hypothetical protein
MAENIGQLEGVDPQRRFLPNSHLIRSFLRWRLDRILSQVGGLRAEGGRSTGVNSERIVGSWSAAAVMNPCSLVSPSAAARKIDSARWAFIAGVAFAGGTFVITCSSAARMIAMSSELNAGMIFPPISGPR